MRKPEAAETAREMLIADGTIKDITWDEWSAELVELGGDRYGPLGVIEECGEECWRIYYDDGYTAKDALDDDASYG